MLTVIGEALIDEVVRGSGAVETHVGGSPMNVAVGLARLGHAVQFLGRIGQDPYGTLISAHLHGNSVLVPLARVFGTTSVARASLGADHAASYDFDLDWELPGFDPEPNGTHRGLLQATTLLHTGSIASMLQPGCSQVFKAVLVARPHATIAYDPNCRPTIVADVDYARNQAEQFVRLADVVKASDEDLRWLYPALDPLQAARNWLRIGGAADGPAVVVVTMGADGPWAVNAAGETHTKVPPAEVVDTVGAGDSFMAALLSTLVDRELDGAQRREALRSLSAGDLTEILRYAAAAAAVTVSRAGADPPRRADLQLQHQSQHSRQQHQLQQSLPQQNQSRDN
ncbi:carbohydrate kinase [Paenarthrobacter sp. Z7-10]|uniref:carbohydrate kinase family protein n=1 Tax=Paenarthrobacter sp. Z7-10 TaxID=2787635 RepID=UPI0022A9EE4B|nr:carbohydrate kinase [Paenarthrobacter sp. Z7-10]MCZ2401924.1 carbohydrate kinase [Paenarthrobacter sp. Z7-10]